MSLQAMKQQSLDLSLQRYSMRGARPRGENTADAVQSLLCKQQGQLQKSLKAIQSCLNECDNLTKQCVPLSSPARVAGSPSACQIKPDRGRRANV